MHYSSLVKVYEALEATTKRLEKTKILADFLRTVPEPALAAVIQLLRGTVFPPWDKRTLGFSSSLAVKAISVAAGASEATVKEHWKREGDLGAVAVKLVGKKQQATLVQHDLTVHHVLGTLQKLPAVEGKGSVDQKVKSVASLLSSCDGEGARFLLRTVLEELRVGVADGTLRDALTWAYLNPHSTYNIEKNTLDFETENGREEYNQLVEAVQGAYDRCNDFTVVAQAAKKGVEALAAIRLELGTPVRVMLAQRSTGLGHALEQVGLPAACEYKYDGFRLQISKDGEEVTLFTRRLENVTTQFPDVVAAVKEHVKAEKVLLDAEAVGFDPRTKQYKPFQEISQRIRRKYEITKLSEKLPVEVNVFDVLYWDGETLLNTPFGERRRYLKTIIPKDIPQKIRLSEYIEVSRLEDADDFYQRSLAAGNEGVMCKALDGPYKPGSRVGHMVKVKPVMDSMDLVIVAAEWGEGKRSGWLTSFTLACQEDGELKTIGRVGTGLKELEGEHLTFHQLTELLKPLLLAEEGREVTVKPEVVLEIAFEEIQQSPSYGSGYALRFPRVLRLRDDRGPEEATTLDEVRAAYEHQRGR